MSNKYNLHLVPNSQPATKPKQPISLDPPTSPRYPPPSNKRSAPTRAPARAYARVAPRNTQNPASPAPQHRARDGQNSDSFGAAGLCTQTMCAQPRGADASRTCPCGRLFFHSTQPDTRAAAAIVSRSIGWLQSEQLTFMGSKATKSGKTPPLRMGSCLPVG